MKILSPNVSQTLTVFAVLTLVFLPPALPSAILKYGVVGLMLLIIIFFTMRDLKHNRNKKIRTQNILLVVFSIIFSLMQFFIK